MIINYPILENILIKPFSVEQANEKESIGRNKNRHEVWPW
jgi:hypothetical protein